MQICRFILIEMDFYFSHNQDSLFNALIYFWSTFYSTGKLIYTWGKFWGMGIYPPPQYLTRGGLCNHPIPPPCCKMLPIVTNSYKYSVKINRFCSKNGWSLMIVAIFFYPTFSQNSKFFVIVCSKFVPKSIHQIARFQFQKYKIFQLLRGHIPPRHTLCVQACSY